MEKGQKVRFRDLSGPLKFVAVYTWIQFALMLLQILLLAFIGVTLMSAYRWY
jgi:hypothetical protein